MTSVRNLSNPQLISMAARWQAPQPGAGDGGFTITIEPDALTEGLMGRVEAALHQAVTELKMPEPLTAWGQMPQGAAYLTVAWTRLTVAQHLSVRRVLLKVRAILGGLDAE